VSGPAVAPLRLRALAPAKVNLGLYLGPTRPDGRHELVTVLESLSLADELELTVGPDSGSEPPGGRRGPRGDRVICDAVTGENLAARALAALRERGWDGPPLALRIAKRIPVAAGMGGGSADAAAALRLALALAPGRPEQVDAIAATLGADVPGQLVPGVALATGAGELVERFEPLAPHAFVVLPSPHQLATADVYREADRLGLPRTAAELAERYAALREVLRPGARLAAALLVNDLAPAAVSLCPSIGAALTAVRGAGAEHALVSGSGPTVVGLWWGAGAAESARAAAARLSERHPGACAAAPVSAEFAAPALA
jgi:4-diphosphocytidyl-2-C-methyl-D-erythritol kinase